MVTDYDINMVGSSVSITIDHERGDTFSEDDKAYRVHLSAKPSKINPKESFLAEDITLFKRHIIAVWKKDRELVESAHQEQNWLDAWKDQGGTIQ